MGGGNKIVLTKEICKPDIPLPPLLSFEKLKLNRLLFFGCGLIFIDCGWVSIWYFRSEGETS